MKKPLVSISCITYNHVNYIKDAVEGFLMQKTDFDFEILIHDDASTDGTTEIIKEYEKKYPNIIKPLYEEENQWQKGRRGSVVFNFPRAQGKYIALCEGDDYWTDPYKLQKQVDFLESNSDYSLVTDNAIIKYTNTDKQELFNIIKEGDIDCKSLLTKRQFATASVLFRTHLLDKQFYKLKFFGDTIIWVYLSTKGKIKYTAHVSSVYNRGIHGIVEATDSFEWALLMEKWNIELKKMLPSSCDRKIINQRNFNQFIDAFHKKRKEKEYNDAFLALRKSFKYAPLLTLKILFYRMIIRKV